MLAYFNYKYFVNIRLQNLHALRKCESGIAHIDFFLVLNDPLSWTMYKNSTNLILMQKATSYPNGLVLKVLLVVDKVLGVLLLGSIVLQLSVSHLEEEGSSYKAYEENGHQDWSVRPTPVSSWISEQRVSAFVLFLMQQPRSQ